MLTVIIIQKEHTKKIVISGGAHKMITTGVIPMSRSYTHLKIKLSKYIHINKFMYI